MTRHTLARRPGFTLVELLVAMGIIIALASLALLVVPDVLTQDRTTDGAGTLRQHLMIAKARALRDKTTTGLRLLVGADPTNLARTDPLWVTEFQYVQRPEPQPLNPSGISEYSNPHVEVYCPTLPGGALDTANGPQLYLVNLPDTTRDLLNKEIDEQFVPDLYLPAFKMVVSPLLQPVTATNTRGRFQETVPVTTPAQPYGTPGNKNYRVALSERDKARLIAALGSGDSKSDYAPQAVFRARPLLGEPNVALPRNVCVDLNFGVSRPGRAPTDASRPLDVLFYPNGQVDTRSEGGDGGQIFLWVRDYTKVADMRPATPNLSSQADMVKPFVYADGTARFGTGGEQQVVAIKTRSGSLGVFPVLWPQADGTYPASQNPYFHATQAANAP